MKPAPAFLFLGGLAGAAGTAVAALASHRGGGNLGIAAQFLMVHAPAFLAVAFLTGRRVALSGGVVIALGLILFAGDLIARDLIGNRLFPYAAPSGGGALILGWLVLALSPFIDRDRHAA